MPTPLEQNPFYQRLSELLEKPDHNLDNLVLSYIIKKDKIGVNSAEMQIPVEVELDVKSTIRYFEILKSFSRIRSITNSSEAFVIGVTATMRQLCQVLEMPEVKAVNLNRESY